MLEFLGVESATMTVMTVAMELTVTAMLMALVEIDYAIVLIIQKETTSALRQ